MPIESNKPVNPWVNDDVILFQRKRFIVPVTQPLVLISEVQRSGGTLLTQLLDNHPQLHVHPSELHIGRPNKYYWPALDISASPEQLFENLWEHTALLHARDGYSKSGKNENTPLPFVFLGNLQKELFVYQLKANVAETQRNVLDAYTTSYFNAWIDYRGLYRSVESVKYWTSFVARLCFDEHSMDRFFRDYPDGLFISIIRDPVSWYASASNYMPNEYKDIAKACELWNSSTKSALREYRINKDRVLLLSFEELVSNTISALERICRFLKLDYNECLLEPTFNGMPIQSNSSFTQKEGGILNAAYDRSGQITSDDKLFIQRLCAENYAEALAVILD